MNSAQRRLFLSRGISRGLLALISRAQNPEINSGSHQRLGNCRFFLFSYLTSYARQFFISSIGPWCKVTGEMFDHGERNCSTLVNEITRGEMNLYPCRCHFVTKMTAIFIREPRVLLPPLARKGFTRVKLVFHKHLSQRSGDPDIIGGRVNWRIHLTHLVHFHRFTARLFRVVQTLHWLRRISRFFSQSKPLISTKEPSRNSDVTHTLAFVKSNPLRAGENSQFLPFNREKNSLDIPTAR